jgi:hypothetical protein
LAAGLAAGCPLSGVLAGLAETGFCGGSGFMLFHHRIRFVAAAP